MVHTIYLTIAMIVITVYHLLENITFFSILFFNCHIIIIKFVSEFYNFLETLVKFVVLYIS